MASKFRLRATILALAMFLVISNPIMAQVQYHRLIPTFKGQWSEFSEWSIPEQAFTELTNCYVTEQGVLKSRMGAYCFMDSPSTTSPVLGAINYKRWVEGGAREYFVFNTNNKIYYTSPGINNINTNISAEVSYSDDGVPVWLVHYNDLFMANGEENPIRWNQDANCIQIGYNYYDGAVIFKDTNSLSVTGGMHWDADPYHFRVGWDLIIADSNSNDGTYEIKSIDSNVMTLQTTAGINTSLTAESDAGGTYTGVGYPPEIDVVRSTTVTHKIGRCGFYKITGNDYIMYHLNWETLGFRSGMSFTIADTVSGSNDGTYTVNSFDYVDYYLGSIFVRRYFLMYITGDFTAEEWNHGISTFTYTLSTSGEDSFNPTTITGHKSRLFVGGVKQFPTYLFFSISKLLSTQGSYYYDMWRDRVNTVDGSGFIDLQDKVVALIGDYQDSLIIGCENKIMRLRGDDPGFDILTPSQSLVFHPDPISLNTGFVGPNAWCEAQGDIYFMSKSGLQQLKMIEQGGTAKYTTLSLPVNDLIDKMLLNDNVKKISMKFMKDLNLILINCAIDDGNNDYIIAYNVSNQTFSKWTFTDGSEPNCLFLAKGVQLDPNNASGYPYDSPDPYETCWFGSQDGKLWILNQAYDYDRDWEDPNAYSDPNFDITITTARLNMGDPFLLKTFSDAKFMMRELHNYATDRPGTVNIYYRLDNDDWSRKITKNFELRSDTAGDEIDKYEYFKLGGALSGTAHTIQYKITASNKYGLELMGILTEFKPVDYSLATSKYR